MILFRFVCVLTGMVLLSSCGTYHASQSVSVSGLCSPDIVKLAMRF